MKRNPSNLGVSQDWTSPKIIDKISQIQELSSSTIKPSSQLKFQARGPAHLEKSVGHKPTGNVWQSKAIENKQMRSTVDSAIRPPDS